MVSYNGLSDDMQEFELKAGVVLQTGDAVYALTPKPREKYLKKHDIPCTGFCDVFECLGDAVLWPEIAFAVKNDYPDLSSQAMSELVSSLSMNKLFYKIGTDIGIDKCIKYIKGLPYDRKQSEWVEDAFEAMMYVLYKEDNAFETNKFRNFVETHIMPYAGEILEKMYMDGDSDLFLDHMNVKIPYCEGSLSHIEDYIDYEFQQPLLVMRALYHPRLEDRLMNERDNMELAIIGDKVLKREIALGIIKRYPDVTQEHITRFMQYLDGTRLQDIALDMHLGDYVSNSNGSYGNKISYRDLRSVFNSVMGALYYDDVHRKHENHDFEYDATDIRNERFFPEIVDKLFFSEFDGVPFENAYGHVRTHLKKGAEVHRKERFVRHKLSNKPGENFSLYVQKGCNSEPAWSCEAHVGGRMVAYSESDDKFSAMDGALSGVIDIYRYEYQPRSKRGKEINVTPHSGRKSGSKGYINQPIAVPLLRH